MLPDQKQILISSGQKTIRAYSSARNKMVSREGYFIESKNHMTGVAIQAFKNILKVESIETNWDEICEIFDTIQGK
jgi:hypothetical protein